MSELDLYVTSIVKGIGSAEDKEDMIEELSDHLFLLKQDFIKEGYSEQEAVKKAIEQFGDSNKINSSLEKTIMPYKLMGKMILIAIGLVIALLVYKSFTDMSVLASENNELNLEITAQTIIKDETGYTYRIDLYNNEDFTIENINLLVGTHPIKAIAEPSGISVEAKKSYRFSVVLQKTKNEINDKKVYVEVRGNKINSKGYMEKIEFRKTLNLQ